MVFVGPRSETNGGNARAVSVVILFVINTGHYGGAEKHLLYLARHLSRDGMHCTILCYGSDFYSERLGPDSPIRVVRRDRVEGRGFWSYVRTFRGLRPDVVVFTNGWRDAFPVSCHLAALAAGARRIFNIEHLTPPPAPAARPGRGPAHWLRGVAGWQSRYMWGTWLEARLCHRTICVSEATRARLIEEYGFPVGKTLVISNGVDLRHYQPARDTVAVATRGGHVPGPCVLLSVSRFEARKRIDVLLDALALLPRTGAWTCVIVGDGPLRDTWMDQCRTLGLDGVVEFVGFREDVRPYLAAADIFVAPSDHEGMPLTLAEAMAYGLPCVATDIGGHDEIVVDGETGRLVPPGSPTALAAAIVDLLAHPEKREALGVNGRKRVEERFNLEPMLEQYEHVLRG
jgi:glycosyltransferase involved in cell wall biosynthesis